jgi:2,4-didehydro-3-deoxy-L-rhamnonate hydrolase
MKLVTFAFGRESRLGLLHDEQVIDLAEAAKAAGEATRMFADALAFLEAGEKARAVAERVADFATSRRDANLTQPLGEVRLRAPIPRPPKILALAGNYAEHIREGGGVAPARENTTPQVFMKPVTTIIATEEPIRLPGPFCTAVDYEGELAVVIGRAAKNVAAKDALAHVAGYANFNDVSGRRLNIQVERAENARTGFFDWLGGKWFDTFGPFGPYLVLAEEIPDPQALRLETRVNGTVRQSTTTGAMIFTVAETIAWISQFVTLVPGDIIATGTPAGVGSTTRTFLKDGDVVEVEIEGLGVLRNPVRA